MQSNGYRPVIDVVVTLSAAAGSHPPWSGDTDEAIRVIVEQCSGLFHDAIRGRIESARHSHFNHNGIIVSLLVTAPLNDRVIDFIKNNLLSTERALETNLQVHFGVEHSAVHVQVDRHPSVTLETGAASGNGYSPNSHGAIQVYTPPGANGAVAPVIVSMPAHPDAIPIDVEQRAERRFGRSLAVLGGVVVAVAIVAFGLVIFIDQSRATENQVLAEDLAQERELRVDEYYRYRTDVADKLDQMAEAKRRYLAERARANALARQTGRPATSNGQPPIHDLPDTDQSELVAEAPASTL